MKDWKISPLHCGDCSEELLRKVEEATGVAGFAYDPHTQLLHVPEGADEQVVRAVLDAGKVALRPREEKTRADAHHGHSHSHDHGHHHGENSSVRNIAIVFAMNLLFAIAEFVFGALLNSTAIFADAVHDLGDALSVGLAFFLEKKSRKHADKKYSFGHRRFSLLGALITGIVLIVGSLFALMRSVPRLLRPEAVNYDGMLVMAVLAILLNGVSAWALSRGHSRNEGMLNLHMLEDMVGWIGILVISIILRFQPWYFLDPLMSVAISLFILIKAVPQVLSAIDILMESVPEGVDMDSLERQLLALPGVHGVGHLHVWSMDGESHNFTVTLFTTLEDAASQRKLREEVRALAAGLQVQCSTVEIDYDPMKFFTGMVG